MLCDFTGICVPHRYDPAGLAAWSPDDDDVSTVKLSKRKNPLFTVVDASINEIGGCSGEYLYRSLEVETALGKRPASLTGIELDQHT
jgi:hypothetical protein